MAFYTVEYFLKRKKELEDVFNVIKPDLQELADYFSPRSVQFIARNVRKPIVKNKKIIDSTPLIALRNFSSGMMSGATSPTNRWFKTSISNIDLTNDYYLKNWCSKQEELTRQILYSSNFYQCLPEIYKQLGIFGFCATAIEPDYDTVVNFKVLPIGSYFYAKNHKGKIDTFCRVYMETAKNILDCFGDNCPLEIKEAVRENPLKLYELVHFVKENKYYKEKRLSSKFAKYVSVVILSSKMLFFQQKDTINSPMLFLKAHIQQT